MKCEYYYCIYNQDGLCPIDEIQINQLGMCDGCEIVTIPDEHLAAYKKKRLDTIAEIWKDYDED